MKKEGSSSIGAGRSWSHVWNDIEWERRRICGAMSWQRMEQTSGIPVPGCELTIPADWDGKYGLEVDEDANSPYGTVSVYHKASQKHFQQSMVRKILVDICLH